MDQIFTLLFFEQTVSDLSQNSLHRLLNEKKEDKKGFLEGIVFFY